MQYLAMYNSNLTRQENSNVPTGVAFYQAYLHPSVISTHQKILFQFKGPRTKVRVDVVGTNHNEVLTL